MVDQSWFNTQIASGSFSTIDNVKDGNLGSVKMANVGSSSDRVDSALNGLAVLVNTAPTATNDVADGTNGTTAAVESGVTRSGASNVVVSTVNASGNVLTNTVADSDADGDTLSVTQIGFSASAPSAVASGTTSANGAIVAGKYGSLTLGADGSYSYVVNNQNASVNALQVGSTLNDVFTYTLSDGRGGTANATLTIVIKGTDDAPVANPDYNTAKESTTGAGAITGYSATGTVAAGTHVLANDTDVDTGDTKTVTGVEVNGTFTTGTVTNVAPSSNLEFTTTENSFNTNTINGKRFFYSDGTTFRQVYTSGGAIVTAGVAALNGNVWTVPLSGMPSYYLNASSQQVQISDWKDHSVVFSDATTATTTGTGSDKNATSKTNTTVGATLNVSGTTSGTLAVGMTLSSSSTGSFTAGTKISALVYTSGALTQVKLDQQVSFTSGAALTFTGTTTLGQTLQGAHGSLVLNGDGSYPYTPSTDNALLATGESAVEVFDYTMKDSQNVTSSSKLYITVLGSSSVSPVLVDDSGTAYEAGVGRSTANNALVNDNTVYNPSPFTSTYANAAGNVLTNDTSYTGRVVERYSRADGSATATAGNLLTGVYGSLTISSTGDYSYKIDNSNSAVSALRPTQTLTETFQYKVNTTSSGATWARLTITIQGTNDAPTAVADTASVTEDSLVSSAGNVLANDTEPELASGDSLSVSRVGTSSLTVTVTGASVGTGQTVAGTYGDLTLGADGSYVYVLRNNAANVQALAYNASAQDLFTYEVKDAHGATSSTTLTITVNGSNEAPVNTTPASVTASKNTAYSFNSAISIADTDGNLASATLHVDNGALSSTYTNAGLTVTVSNSGKDVLLTGSQTLINNYLAELTYTPVNNNDFELNVFL